MSSPGTLLAHDEIATGITGARAWRVRYASHDMHGHPHEATGLVVAPTAAATDRPVLTWCHGTTGLGDAACPSAMPDPARELVPYFTPASTQSIDYGIPGLQGFIDAGWVVAATDYQGLGSEGMHQYMVNRTNARDAVCIARAAIALPVSAGALLGCMGWSQGGGAAVAVAELDAADYGPFTLVGTVGMSPGVSRFAMDDPRGASAALVDASIPPDGHLVMLMCGHHATNPRELPLSDVLTPLGEQVVSGAWNVQTMHHLCDTITRMFRFEGAILQPTPANGPAWKAAIAAGAAGQHRPACPVLVCVDSFDGGTVVAVSWQQAYIDAATALGGTVEVRDYPHDDHFSLPGHCVGDAVTWMTARFAQAGAVA